MLLLYLYGFVLIFEAIIKASKVQFFFFFQNHWVMHIFSFPQWFRGLASFGISTVFLAEAFSVCSGHHRGQVFNCYANAINSLNSLARFFWELMLNILGDDGVYISWTYWSSNRIFSLIFYYTRVYDFSGCLKFGCLRFWHSLCGVTMCIIMVLQ